VLKGFLPKCIEYESFFVLQKMESEGQMCVCVYVLRIMRGSILKVDGEQLNVYSPNDWVASFS